MKKDKERTCRTCKWLSDEFTSVCVNAESQHVADFVEFDKSCRMWKEKGEDENVGNNERECEGECSMFDL